jgi:hypothetical protein
LRYCRSGDHSGNKGWAITNVVKHDKLQIGTDAECALAVIAPHTAFLASRGAFGDHNDRISKLLMD